MLFEIHKEGKIAYKRLSDADIKRSELSHQTHIGLSNDSLTFMADDKTEYSIVNAYYDKEDVTLLVNSIRNNINWLPSKEIKSELRVFVPSQLRTDDDAYFSIYNKTTNQYNILPETTGNYEIYLKSI